MELSEGQISFLRHAYESVVVAHGNSVVDHSGADVKTLIDLGYLVEVAYPYVTITNSGWKLVNMFLEVEKQFAPKTFSEKPVRGHWITGDYLPSATIENPLYEYRKHVAAGGFYYNPPKTDP